MGRNWQRVFAVDDDPLVLKLLEKILEADYTVATSTSAVEAVQLCRQFAPDLVLLDLRMPSLDGFEVCRRLRTAFRGRRLAIIIVSAYFSQQEQAQAFAAGADDYIAKPINPLELQSRVKLHFRLLDAITKVDQIRHEVAKDHLESSRRLEEQQRELLATRDVAVLTLARIAEARDVFTGKHLERIRAYSDLLARQLRQHGPYVDQIDQRFLQDLHQASTLHDVGKVAISDSILLKPGKLTPDEWERMKQHSRVGARILDEAVRRGDGGKFLAMAVAVARSHHERFDGGGYPDGLSGEDIPLAARIVAVADVFDALTSPRPYKPAWSALDAKQVIEMESAGQFDPAVVEAFVTRFNDFVEVQSELTDALKGFTATDAPDHRELVGVVATVDSMR